MHYAVKFLIRSLSLYTSRASIFLLLNYFRENILVKIEVVFQKVENDENRFFAITSSKLVTN